jgi:hypothetical protein
MMKKTGLLYFGWMFGVVCFFAIGYGVSQSPESGGLDSSSEAAPLYLGGYLPSAPGKKAYLKIQNGKIAAMSSKRPAASAVLVDSEAWIFPGLINLHNHLEYNFLPLWSEAKGQFKNRFEWRNEFSAYKDFTTFNKKAIPEDKNCASVRWAELKELVAGVTTTGGLSDRRSDIDCAVGFGPRNFEQPNEIKPGFKSEDATDTITPEMQTEFFAKVVAPLQKEKGFTYVQVIEYLDQKYQISNWATELKTKPKGLASALELLAGQNFGVTNEEEPKAAFARIKPALKTEMFKNLGVEEKNLEKRVTQISDWIFGNADPKSQASAYMNTDLANLDPESSKARSMLTAVAVVKIPDAIRKHFTQFEMKIRQPLIESHQNALGIFYHLSEGHPHDEFSKHEYDYVTQLGLNFPEVVLIHGVGLSEENLDQVAKLGQSMVWSPISNLLLYGETLNIQSVKNRKINFAIGSDWSASGGKGLLEELRFAKKYLQISNGANLTDEELVQTVTVNAAKALRVPDLLGKVAPGYLADLLFVQKKSNEPYKDFVLTSEKEIELVVVGGEPMYGSQALIQGLMAKSPGAEILYEDIDVCGSAKAFRIKKTAKMDSTWDLRSAKTTEETLKSLMANYRSVIQTTKPGEMKNLVSLDPMFACQDPAYQAFVQNFLDKDLQKNRDQREQLRKTQKLDD